MGMSHRERVETALAHRQPDRVPIDIWGSSSRLCDELYRAIHADQGWQGLGRVVRASRSGDYVDERVDVLIDSDFRHVDIGHPKNRPARPAPEGERWNEWGWRTKEAHSSSIVTFSPLAAATCVDEIEAHAWPAIRDPGRIEGLAELARRFHEETDCFIGATHAVSGMMIEIGQNLRGYEQFMMDMYLDESFSHHLIGKIADHVIELYLYYLEPIAPYVGWVEFSSDHGMQDRSLIAPDIYRKFLKGPYKRVFDAVRKAVPQARIWLHSCGSVRELIPDFIEMGVDVLNSLQPKATGMDSLELKREFGSEIVFHGGLDLQGGITGSVEDARDEARRRLDAFSPGGGYIFAPSNHLMQDVSLENFYAIYKVAREYRAG